MQRLWQAWRRHRVVHVNGNILLAGILSAAGTSLLLHVTRDLLDHAVLITIITVVVDGLLDMGAFALLHWITSKAGWDEARGTLATDTAVLQLQRFVLVPLFLVLAIGGQWLLLTAGFDRVLTVWIAYLGALVVTRVIHTAYGLRTGRLRDASPAG